MAQLLTRLRGVLKAHGVSVGWLVLLWLLLFSRTLFGGQFFAHADLRVIYYPIEHVFAQFQAAWQLPEWSPYFGFGHPLLAWGQIGFFTPLHLALRALSISTMDLLQSSIVLHALVGLLGVYAWLRNRRLSAAAAVLGAAVYVFNGYAVAHFIHINIHIAGMILPWLLLAISVAVDKLTVRSGVVLTLVASVMVMSGQPQTVIFASVIAALWAVAISVARVYRSGAGRRRILISILCLFLLVGVISFFLSSLRLLPFWEFLSQTSRGQGVLERESLYEFSLPPAQLASVAVPYLFGSGEAYWGAKSQIELAAGVGLVPLSLSGVALLFIIRRRLTERVVALTLVVVGVAMALGKYSPLYRLLVESEVITAVGGTGRYLLLTVTGLALLAAIGLDDLTALSSQGRWRALVGIIGWPLLWVAPLAYLAFDHMVTQQIFDGVAAAPVQAIAALVGLIVLVGYVVVLPRRWRVAVTAIVVGLAVLALVLPAWLFHPLVARSELVTAPPFRDELLEYRRENIFPARLYSRAVIRQQLAEPWPARRTRTDALSPEFSVHQPFVARHNNLSCVSALVDLDLIQPGSFTLAIREGLESGPLREVQFSPRTVHELIDPGVCFEPIADSAGRSYVASFTSEEESKVRLFYGEPENSESEAYFVRVAAPSSQQFRQSRKPAQVFLQARYSPPFHQDTALLAAHLNALADSGSIDWVGALPLRAYEKAVSRLGVAESLADLHRLGVTHVVQLVPDGNIDQLETAGWPVVDRYHFDNKEARLYQNPQVWPRVYLATADGTPRWGEQVAIVSYQPTEIEIAVKSKQAGTVVLAEARSRQWSVLVDGREVAPKASEQLWRSVDITAGEHTVVWRYRSAATRRALILTLLGIVLVVVLWWNPAWLRKTNKRR